jgi:hypothetical protein
VCINKAAAEIRKEQMRVSNGELLYGDPPKLARGFDYCLLRLAYYSQREDFAGLPFLSEWSKLRELVWGQEAKSANKKLLELARAISLSPELLPADQCRLIQILKADFEAEVERAAPFHGKAPLKRGVTPRGDGPSGVRALNRIQDDIYLLNQNGNPEAKRAFAELQQAWHKIEPAPGLDKDDARNATRIASQMRTLKLASPDPAPTSADKLVDGMQSCMESSGFAKAAAGR